MSAASLTRSMLSAVNRLIRRGRASEPRLLRQRHAPERRDAEAVGHARDVIGHPLDVVGRRAAIRHLFGMVEEVLEEAPDRAPHPLVLAARLLAEVDPLEHEL